MTQYRLFSFLLTTRALTIEVEDMMRDFEFSFSCELLLDNIQIVFHIDFFDRIAAGADEMMVVPLVIDLVALHTIGELDGTEDSLHGQKLQLPIDGTEIGINVRLAQHLMNILSCKMLVIFQKNTNQPLPARGHTVSFGLQNLDDVLFSVHMITGDM